MIPLIYVSRLQTTALTTEMYNEFKLCSSLPSQLEYEEVSSTIQEAVKARRGSEVARLKEQRANMGYVPAADVTAAEMIERLKALLVSLELRHSQLLEEEDTNNCVLCKQFTDKVKRLLAS
jgi:hypothetical protein